MEALGDGANRFGAQFQNGLARRQPRDIHALGDADDIGPSLGFGWRPAGILKIARLNGPGRTRLARGRFDLFQEPPMKQRGETNEASAHDGPMQDVAVLPEPETSERN